MTTSAMTVEAVSIKVAGAALATDQMTRLGEVTVEQNRQLPDMFIIRFYDINGVADAGAVEPFGILDAGKVTIGAEVEIGMGYGTTVTTIIKGEITAIEVDVAPDGTPVLTARGYARSHRLHRGRQSRSFVDMKDSDIVGKIAQEAGLTATADATATTYKYVYQRNQTNWEFLQELKLRNGYEMYVDDKKLYFQKPQVGKSAGPDQDFGKNLASFRVRVSSAHQVSSVEVKGWDWVKQTAITGTANSSDVEPETGWGKTAVQAVSGFGNAKLEVTDHPVMDQNEANTLAKAIMNNTSGSFITAEAVSIGDPKLKPGVTVKLNDLGTKLSGKYYITTATHRYTPADGYLTTFTASGHQSDSILELVNGPYNPQTLPSVVCGVVTDNSDKDDNYGRVKVKFPWLNAADQSWWARVATPMAGGQRGIFFLPEIGDEVLVAFEHGDITRPYVIGSVWNGVDKPPKKNSEVLADSKVKERIIKTRAGHTISLDDTNGEEKISIIDKTNKNMIVINSKDNTISITSEKDVAITAKGKTTITSTGDTVVDSKANVTVKAAQNVEVKATSNVKINGQAGIDIESTGALKLKGAQVDIEATGMMNIKATGPLAVKGAVINLN